MAESVGSLSVDILADDKTAAGIASASGSIKAFGESVKDIGTSLSGYVTAPLLGIGYAAVSAFDDAAKATAGVESRLQRFGAAAGGILAKLQADAAGLQSTTLFDDDDILQNVTQQLLTFGSISGETFDRAQTAALDLSTTLGQSLQSSAIQLGKALNDPIKGVSALGRVGIQFSESQKATIKTLQESGDLLGAQALILKEVETYYGGAAAAAAAAGTGGFTQAKNAIGDALEVVGKLIVDALNPLADAVKAAAEGFSNLDPATQKTIVAVAAVAAAIGPVLVGLGALITIAPAIAAAWVLITGPVGALVLGVAAGVAVFLLFRNEIAAFGLRIDIFAAELRQKLLGAIADVVRRVADLRAEFPLLFRALGAVVPGFDLATGAAGRIATSLENTQKAASLDLSRARRELVTLTQAAENAALSADHARAALSALSRGQLLSGRGGPRLGDPLTIDATPTPLPNTPAVPRTPGAGAAASAATAATPKAIADVRTLADVTRDLRRELDELATRARVEVLPNAEVATLRVRAFRTALDAAYDVSPRGGAGVAAIAEQLRTASVAAARFGGVASELAAIETRFADQQSIGNQTLAERQRLLDVLAVRQREYDRLVVDGAESARRAALAALDVARRAVAVDDTRRQSEVEGREDMAAVFSALAAQVAAARSAYTDILSRAATDLDVPAEQVRKAAQTLSAAVRDLREAQATDYPVRADSTQKEAVGPAGGTLTRITPLIRAAAEEARGLADNLASAFSGAVVDGAFQLVGAILTGDDAIKSLARAAEGFGAAFVSALKRVLVELSAVLVKALVVKGIIFALGGPAAGGVGGFIVGALGGGANKAALAPATQTVSVVQSAPRLLGSGQVVSDTSVYLGAVRGALQFEMATGLGSGAL